MVTESKSIYDESFKAAADLSAKQYYALEGSGQDGVNVCGAATDRVIGILQNKPAANQAALVRILGISKAISDGSGTAISAWDYVGPNNAGKMVKKATADYSVAGIALDGSSADGTIIRVLLLPGAFFRTAAG